MEPQSFEEAIVASEYKKDTFEDVFSTNNFN